MNRIFIFWIFIVGFELQPVYSQSGWPDSKGEVGYFYSPNDTLRSFDWQAHWIWVDESLDNDVLLARRNFELSQLPEKAQLWITASSQYQLYINGEYIRRGPARSAPHHQSFDVLDVRRYLKLGTNLLAVRVHHQNNKHSYHYQGRAGLLAQLNLTYPDHLEVIVSDNQWKVIADPSWDNKAPVISRFQMVVNDRIDMRKASDGWWKLDFDDHNWSFATPLMRTVGWPSPEKDAKPQPLTPPWTSLVPRDVPYVREILTDQFDLIEARLLIEDYLDPYKTESHQVVSGLKVTNKVDPSVQTQLEKFSTDRLPMNLKLNKDNPAPYLMIFDFKSVLSGFANLGLQGPSGLNVDILYTPHLIDQRFCHNVLDSDFRDQITLSGKKDQWEATYFKPFRYMALVIYPSDEPVIINQVSVRYYKYPFNDIGAIFSSDADWVKRYTEATKKTIDVCTTDAFTDNYRERRQYAQTGYYGALGNYWTFGDYALQRRYLIQVAQEQEPNGIMPAYAPLGRDDYMIIMDSNCLYIRSLKNYYLFSGDQTTLKQLLPSAVKLMELLHSYTNEKGMIDNPPYPYWLDHVQNERNGANLNLNGHYLGALFDFAEILTWLGLENASTYRERGEFLKKNLQLLWDGDHGLFADAIVHGELSKKFSEGANAMALACGVASKEQGSAIAEKLLIKDTLNYITNAAGMTMVTPAMSYFLHKGLCEYGYVKESFELFRSRFDKMLEPEHNGTLWEEWWIKGTGRSGKFNSTKTRSDAQTESAFPSALFGEYLLGILPTMPGWSQAIIKYHSHGLSHIQGKVPTPNGVLQIEWETNADLLILHTDIPNGTMVTLDLNSLPQDKQNIIRNKIITRRSDSATLLSIPQGKSTTQFN